MSTAVQMYKALILPTHGKIKNIPMYTKDLYLEVKKTQLFITNWQIILAKVFTDKSLIQSSTKIKLSL